MNRPFSGAFRARLVIVITFLGTLGWFTSANAFDPEWQWRVDGMSPTFATKNQAVDYLHSLGSTDARLPLLTEEKSVQAAGEQDRYTVPRTT